MKNLFRVTVQEHAPKPVTAPERGVCPVRLNKVPKLFDQCASRFPAQLAQKTQGSNPRTPPEKPNGNDES
tara:strand:- start:17 stop:226 length:210 start_codon:yes stop_codon:yes gene_type:complete